MGADGIPRLSVLDLQMQIRRMPKPVVAMVAGYAVGGGHILHMVCDLTVGGAGGAVCRVTCSSCLGCCAVLPFAGTLCPGLSLCGQYGRAHLWCGACMCSSGHVLVVAVWTWLGLLLRSGGPSAGEGPAGTAAHCLPASQCSAAWLCR